MTAQQLKNSILQMAVQGKLVPQNSDDEPASLLLEKIRKEKRALIKTGKIKKDKIAKPITDEEIPFGIPESWEWVRLSNLGMVIGGGTPKTGNSDYWRNGTIPWLTPADMKNICDKYVSHGERNITESGLKNSSARIMPKNTIVYSTRAPIGYIAISVNPLCTNQGFKSLVPYIDEIIPYLYYCLIQRTPEIKSRASGTTFLEISGSEFANTIIPLPPLNEQKRIVKQIDELLPLMNGYNKVEQEITVLDKEFPAKLKKSVLQAAIQGKLVPQDFNDEPASVLLEHIHAERKRLIRNGKIKRDKDESVIFRRYNSHYEKRGGVERCIDDEIPFNLPENWAWVRLGEIGTFIRGNGIKRSDMQSVGVPCIRYGEIYTTYNIAITNIVSYVNIELLQQLKSLAYGDLLFTLTGENKEEIGKTVAFVSKEKTVIGGDLSIFTNHHQNPMYLSYLMNSPYSIQQKALLGTGNIIVHISCDKLASILVPLPPLAEQERIVSQIEKIWAVT